MNITVMAHDKKKELMVQFCTAYKSVLAKHNLSATATTGRMVADATGLPVSLFMARSQGGHQQVDARIAYNEIDMVIIFTDPNDNDVWEDQRIIQTLRLCEMHNVPVATNLATAEMLILGLQRGDLDWREMARPRNSIR
ncbi:MAG: methylglyoxal synthase [Oscillospiraceae bacterium]|nr:methylglyoxal synthase [Oscillospiraceae bacterium]